MARKVLIACALLAVVALGVLLVPPLLVIGSHKVPPAKMDMANLVAALHQYQAEYGLFPTGEAAQILKTLRGENSRKIVFFSVPPRSVNTRGEFIDPWGTPCELNLLSTNRILVRSAGKNKAFGDRDDITEEH